MGFSASTLGSIRRFASFGHRSGYHEQAPTVKGAGFEKHESA